MSEELLILLIVPYVIVWGAGVFLQWSVIRRLRKIEAGTRPAWVDAPRSLARSLSFLKFIGRKEYLAMGDARLAFRCAMLKVLTMLMAVSLILGAAGVIFSRSFNR